MLTHAARAAGGRALVAARGAREGRWLEQALLEERGDARDQAMTVGYQPTKKALRHRLSRCRLITY